jgi:outer membrane lipoprotein-sorting protein
MENDKIEELLNKIGNEQVPPDVEKITQREFALFNESLKEQRHIKFKEHFMKTNMIKISVAAAVILAILLGIPFFKGTGPTVSLAAVYQKMQLVNAFMYKMRMKTTVNIQPGMPAVNGDSEATITISTEYGMKMDMDMNMVISGTGQKMRQIMYMLPQEKKWCTIMPEQKQYLIMELNDELLAKTKKESNDPRDMVKQVLNCKYTELGRSTINGVEVEGFETTDPAFIGGAMGDVKVTFWVDRKTELPVRAEMYFKMSEQMQMEGVIEDFQWDLKVESSEFEPVIPQDYITLFPGGFKMPIMNEETAIEGLRFSADSTGKYPEKLNMATMMQGIGTIAGDIARQGGDMNNLSQEAIAQKMVETMRPMQSLVGFYMMLVGEKKEPVYYGDVVGPNDIDKVLLRWKTGDNEYRVIYGDLSVETVDGSVLAKLENGLPK